LAYVTGSATFTNFDSDADFIADIDITYNWILKKLGGSQLCVELSSSDIYTSFAEACLEYSSTVNSYQAKSVLNIFLGQTVSSTSGSENTFPFQNIDSVLKLAEAYGEEAGANSQTQLYSGSITLRSGVQQYDLQGLLSGSSPLTGSNASARIKVKEVYHYSPSSAYRFYGGNTGWNLINNQFGFDSFTSESVFYLLPVAADILRGQEFKLSNRIRRSQYSYMLYNNVLHVYPTPTEDVSLWLKFWLPHSTVSSETPGSKVANLSNVPFGILNYSKINSIGRHWIRRMALANAKEILGFVRSKMTTIPVPGGEVTLNGPQLVDDANSEQEALRQELKEMLEELTYEKLQAKQASQAELIEKQLSRIPLGFWWR
jgi:hypothetical protein